MFVEEDIYFHGVQMVWYLHMYPTLISLQLFLVWILGNVIGYQSPFCILICGYSKDSLLMSLVCMDIHGHFFNPCCTSPLNVILCDGYQSRQEVFIQKQLAVAIITGYCMESHLIHAKTFTKMINVLFHG